MMKVMTAATTRLLLRRIGLNALNCLGRMSVIALVVAGMQGQVFAHVQKTAVTRILFNPNTENIEVMHRFLVHDAEHAATLIFGERQTLLESDESRELFSNYVMNRFAIEATYEGGNKALLALDYVGSEVDGQFLWVYQEIADDADIARLSIVHSVLRDIWPDQSNLVNIEREGEIKSLRFDNNVDLLSVEL